ncbi:hypothetical protein [Streptomyces sp. NPDC048551]|uniref:hypothetical protein n=1 Tax=Streptomyces sp. NPDC048551 TaxID=3155758 RepID=UPI0034133E0C
MHTLDHAHLVIELQTILAEGRTLQAEHQARLAPYLTADGEVNEEHRSDWDDARITTAIEAVDRLDTLLAQLGRLPGLTAGPPFTVTIAGSERYDGERPWSFALYATGLDDALRTLPELPAFRDWLREEAELVGPGAEPDVMLVPEGCHPGLPEPGEYIDLRAEQANRPSPAPPNTTAAVPLAISTLGARTKTLGR